MPDGMNSSDTANPLLRQQISDLLIREAELLDNLRYAEWEALWCPSEGRYHIPVMWGPGIHDARGHVSIVDDDRAGIARRVTRLSTDFVHGQDPPARFLRMLTNMSIVETDGTFVQADAKFQLVEERIARRQWFGATRHVVHRQLDGTFRIHEKIVHLVNSREALPAISFIF